VYGPVPNHIDTETSLEKEDTSIYTGRVVRVQRKEGHDLRVELETDRMRLQIPFYLSDTDEHRAFLSHAMSEKKIVQLTNIYKGKYRVIVSIVFVDSIDPDENK